MGNSEVGHMTLGAGRVVYQNFTRINKAISDGDFFTNPVYCDAIDKAVATAKQCILWACSPQAVFTAMKTISMPCSKWPLSGAPDKIYIHASLDGRDCPPRSAKPSLAKDPSTVRQARCWTHCLSDWPLLTPWTGTIAGTAWSRPTDLMTDWARSFSCQRCSQRPQAAYASATRTTNLCRPPLLWRWPAASAIEDGDAVIFMNFRPIAPERSAHALVDKDFAGFERAAVPSS